MFLDTRHAVATPEGVDLELPLAGVVPRATAWLLDLLIRAGILLVAGIALGLAGRFGSGLMMLIAFLVEWFYPVVFELLREGATPGKQSVGLRVVESDGRPVGASASVIRNLLRVADFLPFLYGLGLLFMLFHPRFQRLGDLAAGTLVVWAPGKAPAPALPSVPVVAPPLPLTLREQKALIAFGERSLQLSPARQTELADLLAGLTRRRGEAGVRQLQGMARWLAGER